MSKLLEEFGAVPAEEHIAWYLRLDEEQQARLQAEARLSAVWGKEQMSVYAAVLQESLSPSVATSGEEVVVYRTVHGVG